MVFQTQYNVDFSCLTDLGLVRRKNEDAYGVLDRSTFVLADGMGGHSAGEVASKMACRALLSYFEKQSKESGENGVFTKGSLTDELERSFAYVNRLIYEMGQSTSDHMGMGTTLDCLIIDRQRAYFGHVGDSRIYLLRDCELQQLTLDHSVVGEQLLRGEISIEQATASPKRHTLTRAVGKQSILQIDVGSFDLQDKDLFLLCSDGLSNAASDEEIKMALQQQKSLDEKARQLVALAIARGGRDNITVILVSIENDLPRQ